MNLLPRGNIREFETRLLRTVVEKRGHHDYMNEKYPSTGTLADTPPDVAYRLGMAAAELSAAVNVLAYYADRDPNELHTVSNDFRALERMIREGGSWGKKIKKQMAAYERQQEKENRT